MHFAWWVPFKIFKMALSYTFICNQFTVGTPPLKKKRNYNKNIHHSYSNTRISPGSCSCEIGIESDEPPSHFMLLLNSCTNLQKCRSKPSHLSLHFKQEAPAPNSWPRVICEQRTWGRLGAITDEFRLLHYTEWNTELPLEQGKQLGLWKYKLPRGFKVEQLQI